MNQRFEKARTIFQLCLFLCLCSPVHLYEMHVPDVLLSLLLFLLLAAQTFSSLINKISQRIYVQPLF